jgi:hypothetical protein
LAQQLKFELAECRKQFVLRLERLVQRRARNAGLRGDIGQIELAVAVPAENFERGSQNALAHGVTGLGAIGHLHPLLEL